MFFKARAGHSLNPMYYFVSFHSPYFLLYVKCPKARVWQLARSQQEPLKVVDGSAERTVYPVLLFSSRDDAEHYAAKVLGLRPKKVSFGLSVFLLWHEGEHFEPVTLPEETISVEIKLRVAPVVYVKEEHPEKMGSVHPLPFAERRRD
ncbi:hypothetical protein [Propionivibrio soli]|uniref:hypothetical protein n=1 Tax=Propionivibrio soli TaxID=2976531 RepID=UPI0021E93709|nr:hypothetical protein [Propionivibrio soli]